MRYAKIDKFDVSNGQYAGVSLYVQGCHFRCPGCFNPETWDYKGGKIWTKEVEEEFFTLINRPYIKRVTILGGEPLSPENIRYVYFLVKKIKEVYKDKMIWLYTGYTFESIADNSMYEDTINLVDVIVDGQFEEDSMDLTLKFRGSANQRIIDVKKTLKEGNVVLWNSKD